MSGFKNVFIDPFSKTLPWKRFLLRVCSAVCQVVFDETWCSFLEDAAEPIGDPGVSLHDGACPEVKFRPTDVILSSLQKPVPADTSRLLVCAAPSRQLHLPFDPARVSRFLQAIGPPPPAQPHIQLKWTDGSALNGSEGSWRITKVSDSTEYNFLTHPFHLCRSAHFALLGSEAHSTLSNARGSVDRRSPRPSG